MTRSPARKRPQTRGGFIALCRERLALVFVLVIAAFIVATIISLALLTKTPEERDTAVIILSHFYAL